MKEQVETTWMESVAVFYYALATPKDDIEYWTDATTSQGAMSAQEGRACRGVNVGKHNQRKKE